MKELEARGIVARTVIPGLLLRVEYELSQMGAKLQPAPKSSRSGEPLAAAPDDRWRQTANCRRLTVHRRRLTVSIRRRLTLTVGA